MTTAQKWQKLLGWIRRNFPPHLPVRVRCVPAKRLGKGKKALVGYCTINTNVGKLGRFEIFISRQMSFALRTEVLIHEWSHALTWFGSPGEDDHDAEWGVAYARIYRAFCEWNLGRPVEEEE